LGVLTTISSDVARFLQANKQTVKMIFLKDNDIRGWLDHNRTRTWAILVCNAMRENNMGRPSIQRGSTQSRYNGRITGVAAPSLVLPGVNAVGSKFIAPGAPRPPQLLVLHDGGLADYENTMRFPGSPAD
jgi:hypothetical protein